MNYLFVFFLIFCLSVGFVTLVLSFIFLIKIKSKLSNYFLLFLLFFFIIILIASLSFFLNLFMDIPPVVDFVFSIGSQFCGLAINLLIILFMSNVLNIFKEKKKNMTVFIFILLLSFGFFLSYLYTTINEPYDNNLKTFHISDIFLFLLPFFSIILYFIHYKNINKLIISKTIKSIISVSVFFLPILFLENFNLDFNIAFGELTKFHFRLLTFPLYYLIFNLILLYYGLKFFYMLVYPETKEFHIPENFIDKFNITKREAELILLIYEGYTNKQVSEKLSISPATVRNHLHNIYEKTGSSNRVELLRFCKE